MPAPERICCVCVLRQEMDVYQREYELSERALARQAELAEQASAADDDAQRESETRALLALQAEARSSLLVCATADDARCFLAAFTWFAVSLRMAMVLFLSIVAAQLCSFAFNTVVPDSFDCGACRCESSRTCAPKDSFWRAWHSNATNKLGMMLQSPRTS
jgi:hypothetical protein